MTHGIWIVVKSKKLKNSTPIISMSIPTIEEQIRFAIMNDNDEKAIKLAKMFGYNTGKYIH